MRRLDKRRKDEAIERAWEVYRTLTVNPDEVVAALYEAHVAGIQEAQTATVAQAVWVICPRAGARGQGGRPDGQVLQALCSDWQL